MDCIGVVKKSPWLLIFPLLIVGWGFYTMWLYYPYYTWAIDPEMPYLVNGLNAALLKFDRIGHFDHPGTPFQLFNGIAIRITHAVSGKSSLIEDVFSRPEHYLLGIKIMLTFLQAILTLAIGITGKKKNMEMVPLIILQGGILFSDQLMWVFGRAIPERWFMITTLLFLLTHIKYGHHQTHTLKFAIWSGIWMGMGMATKFNYLPVLIIPFLIIPSWKNRFVYFFSSLLSFILFLSPVLNRFKEYRQFIVSIMQHDGLYGSGEARMINPARFTEGLAGIWQTTPEIVLWFALIAAGLLIARTQKQKTDLRASVSLLVAGLIAGIVQVAMVAKHFKNAYMAPLQSIWPLVLFAFVAIAYERFHEKWIRIFLPLALFLLFAGINLGRMTGEAASIINDLRHRKEARQFVNHQIPKDATWFLEPTWLHGPYPENGIIFGLSYCRQRHRYIDELKKINPNVITYEGHPVEMKSWRIEPVLLDSVIMNMQPVYLYDTPGRNAAMLRELLELAAERNALHIYTDTIFRQAATRSMILQINTRK